MKVAVLVLCCTWLCSFISPVNAGSSWARLGQPVCRSSDWSVSLVDVQDDPTTSGDESWYMMAIGSPTYTNDLYRQGKVEFLSFSTSECLWKPEFANAIYGFRTEDRLGFNVALSCNAQRVAVAGDLSSESDSLQGYVKVYGRKGTSKAWNQVGQTLTDEEGLNAKVVPTNFGRGKLEFSCDGNFLKVESDSGVHVYRFKQDPNSDDVDVGTWTLLKFFEISEENDWIMVSAMARSKPIVAVSNGSEENVTVYELTSSGALETVKREANVTLPNRFDWPEALSISNDGSRIAVGADDKATYVFDFLSESNMWNLTGVNEIYYDSDIFLSGDGSTLFLQDLDGLDAHRLFTIKEKADYTYYDEISDTTQYETKVEEEDKWVQLGNNRLELFTGDQYHSASISSTGSVVALSARGAVEVLFFPDDPNSANLNCYPNQELEETQECFSSPGDEEETQLIKGDIKIEDDEVGEVASLIFGILAFLFIAAVLALVYRMWRYPESNSDTLKPSKDAAIVMKQSKLNEVDEEMVPLKEERPRTGYPVDNADATINQVALGNKQGPSPEGKTDSEYYPDEKQMDYDSHQGAPDKQKGPMYYTPPSTSQPGPIADDDDGNSNTSEEAEA